MTSGLSGSSLSAPEVEVLASVPGDTLSFIHLYVSVLDSVQVNQRQWAKPNSKVRVSLYNKSETHKIKAFFFFSTGEPIQKTQASTKLQSQRYLNIKDSRSMASLTSMISQVYGTFTLTALGG